MKHIHDVCGTHYTCASMAAVASSDNTAVVAVIESPFSLGSAKIVSIDHIPAAAVTGDATNSCHFNALLIDGSTEIANLDYDAAINGVLGTPKAFTLSGTAAQLTVAAGGCILIQREEIGTQPVMIAGHRFRVGWQGA